MASTGRFFPGAWPNPMSPLFESEKRKQIEYEEEEYNLIKRRRTGWYMCLLAFLLPILVGMIVLTAYVLYPRTNGVNVLKVDAFNFTCPDSNWVIDKTVGAIGKCYKFQTTAQPISESKTDCESLDPSSHLVAIKSAAEQASIEAIHATLTAGTCSQGYWTSGKRNPTDLTSIAWYDGSGTTAPAYENWEPGLPSANTGKECLMINVSKGLKWRDRSCQLLTVRCYICEI